jgi:hypothetical protein
LSTQLPGFNVDDARAKLQWSHDRTVVSDFHFTNNANELEGNFTGGYTQTLNDDDGISMEIAARGHINPNGFSYFLSDSVMQYFNHWQSTELNVEAYYNIGKGEIETLDLKTGNSQLQASGKVSKVLDLEKLYWNDLAVEATIGLDFKISLAPFLQNVDTPSDAKLELKSSGNLKSALIDGKAFTQWGNVSVNGMVGMQADNFKTDLNLTGEEVNLGKWMDVSAIGPMNFTLHTKGMFGRDNNAEINGSTVMPPAPSPCATGCRHRFPRATRARC